MSALWTSYSCMAQYLFKSVNEIAFKKVNKWSIVAQTVSQFQVIILGQYYSIGNYIILSSAWKSNNNNLQPSRILLKKPENVLRNSHYLITLVSLSKLTEATHLSHINTLFAENRSQKMGFESSTC